MVAFGNGEGVRLIQYSARRAFNGSAGGRQVSWPVVGLPMMGQGKPPTVTAIEEELAPGGKPDPPTVSVSGWAPLIRTMLATLPLRDVSVGTSAPACAADRSADKQEPA